MYMEMRNLQSWVISDFHCVMVVYISIWVFRGFTTWKYDVMSDTKELANFGRRYEICV